MTVIPGSPVRQHVFEGTTYRFCSDRCHREFARAPRHYLGLAP